MSYAEPLFSVDHYDQDGDIVQRGVYLYFGDTRIKVAEKPSDFKWFVQHLQNLQEEIEEYYVDP